MIEDIKSKLDSDMKCELSVEELKILYSINNNYMEEMIDYMHSRIVECKYVDFIKLFGKEKIAYNISEITENTIAYIGQLIINEPLPTYNLKYITGDLLYNLNEIIKLENLEVVYKSADFLKVKGIDGIENLRIASTLQLNNAECEILPEFEFIKHLKLRNGSNLNLKNCNVKGLTIIDSKHIDNLLLNEGLEIIDLKLVETIKDLILPSSLVRADMGHLISYYNLVLNDGLKELNLYNIKNIDGLVLPDSIEILYLNNIESLRNVTLPKNLRYLTIGDLSALKGCTLYDDISVRIKFKIQKKKQLAKVAQLISREENKTKIYSK